MKRYVSLALSIILILSLIGCGSNDSVSREEYNALKEQLDKVTEQLDEQQKESQPEIPAETLKPEPTPEETIDPDSTTEPSPVATPTSCSHTISDWIVDIKASCTTEGEKHTECTKCKEVVGIETIPPAGHTPDAEATCTAEQNCTVCGAVLAEKAAHVESDWIVDNKATCTTEGEEHTECTKCKEVIETETIPPTGHTPGAEATCTAEQTCIACGAVLAAKTAHTEVVTPSVPATVTTSGLSEGRCCSICDKVIAEQVVIPATGSIGLEFLEYNNSYIVVGPGTCTDTVVYVPAKYNGKDVTEILNMAFESCSFITKIVLPDTIHTIGGYAFRDCINLNQITMPDSVDYIGDYAFWGCVNLSSIIIPSGVTELSYGLFDGCTALRNISLPSSLSYIDTYAFSGCSSLGTIIIPDNVTGIGSSAFENCTSLGIVSMPANLKTIGRYAFDRCISLYSVILPDGLTTIEYGAFEFCPALIEVVIPNSVSAINEYAFLGCKNLVSIYFDGTVKQWKNLYKESNWDESTGNYTIYCNDGNIRK